MRIRKYGLFAAMLAAGACLLSGCGQVDDSVFESTADFSVNISVPFATTEPDEIAEEDRAQVEIDANGNVTVNDYSLLNSSYTRQTNDDEAEYETLELGDTGLAVQALQQRLQELGYFSGGISGIFDAATETAVRPQRVLRIELLLHGDVGDRLRFQPIGFVKQLDGALGFLIVDAGQLRNRIAQLFQAVLKRVDGAADRAALQRRVL